MGASISEEDWDQAIRRIHSSSVCMRHCVIQFKVVHRLHYSKERLSRIYPELNPKCDRCTRETADLFHMFWSCPKLTPFWKSIFDALTTVLHCSLIPSPLIAIFGVVPAGVHLSATQANLVAYSTLLL